MIIILIMIIIIVIFIIATIIIINIIKLIIPARQSNLQASEGVVLKLRDLVPSQVEDPEVLQAPEHVCCDQVDEVPVEGQLQQLSLAEEGPVLQG